ncbi:hypothetical protein THAOC_24339 [Thalassiosira oceanica]|uniref:Uncharacterized protein n=1 Tax=Thalassiosira oceanica TaxID=159749 RepID=K0RQ19_THAOC|nr:hypothetical protein THAOC_24339 [Thalassiosira oceanica]|eukprot:EJK55873.1 hypothetical protein THAOC_24339 [Thalassiosira oceanica]
MARRPSLDSEGARRGSHWPLALGGLTGGDDDVPSSSRTTELDVSAARVREARGRTCPGPCVAVPARGRGAKSGAKSPRKLGRGRRGPGGGGASRTRPSSAAGCVTRRNGAAVVVEWTGASLVDDGYAVIPGASPKYENDERTSRPGAHTNATINSLKWDGEESQPTYHSLRNALVLLHLLGSNDYKLAGGRSLDIIETLLTSLGTNFLRPTTPWLVVWFGDLSAAAAAAVVDRAGWGRRRCETETGEGSGVGGGTGGRGTSPALPSGPPGGDGVVCVWLVSSHGVMALDLRSNE